MEKCMRKGVALLMLVFVAVAVTGCKCGKKQQQTENSQQYEVQNGPN